MGNSTHACLQAIRHHSEESPELVKLGCLALLQLIKDDEVRARVAATKVALQLTVDSILGC